MDIQNIIKGKKANMTQVFTTEGKVVPVTIVYTDAMLTEDFADKAIVLVGKSKGKGFTGVMKKWNFKGAMATRGQSDKPRAPGSIGSQTPGRVYKGKKMAGRHGNARITLKGLRIVSVHPERKQLMISGPIPGARNSDVLIRIVG